MEPAAPSNDLQLGMLIAKADATFTAIQRVEENLRDLTARISDVERGLGSKITDVERDLAARISAHSSRLTTLEAGSNHKRENAALAFSLFAAGGMLANLLKSFGVF